ncbi:MAG: 3'(2'),5'-bisphosphate nucleotidase CysQ [Gammaproteobacteria bacterium]|nr:3'(2'),5'-bisphosphate nucleotidase CysQ [Gammaproteobacteria bacterium]MCY4219182.1 3'(2'),5'-bisphosphate nucleotidase CysQ [Gammaproteobacteria bacterium]
MLKEKITYSFLEDVASIAVSAGRIILDIYENHDLAVEYKKDGSPLTMADLHSHKFILTSLQELTPDIPILSEESSPEIHRQRINWSTLWLVDPLDGTKGFVQGNGEFTVNIALIQDSKPILGVVYTPVRNLLQYAALGVGAFCVDAQNKCRPIQTREISDQLVVVVSSRSIQDANLNRFISKLKLHFSQVETYPLGSSLKFCLLADGLADIYPRFGPTSEWDTAAAQCILEVAGGKIQNAEGNSLEYNKLDIVNSAFIASGSFEANWTEFFSEQLMQQ